MKIQKNYDYLCSVIKKRGAGFLCLIDPDNQSITQACAMAKICAQNGADAILVGGSIMVRDQFNDTIHAIKNEISLPVLIFPGIFNFVSPDADALLFISMISSRNPQLLIGEQVRAAPLIKKFNVESIPTGYMIIESGAPTSVQYMSQSIPIPRQKYDIAKAHALAAQYLGMQMIFMDGGSGAQFPVENTMIHEVKKSIDLPLIIGGGIRTPNVAQEKVNAGADFIVVGTALENHNNAQLIHEFADAIHTKA